MFVSLIIFQHFTHFLLSLASSMLYFARERATYGVCGVINVLYYLKYSLTNSSVCFANNISTFHSFFIEFGIFYALLCTSKSHIWSVWCHKRAILSEIFADEFECLFR